MNETKDKVVAPNVRLKSIDSSAHAKAAKYTNVGVAQGIAYVDFGFIEPSLLGLSRKLQRMGKQHPKMSKGS